MRPTLALFALTLTCGPSYTPQRPLGGRDVPVAIVDCLEPQRGWIASQIESFGWHIADAGELTIRCADTGPGGGAEEFELGSNEVLFDPVKAPGEFAGRAAPSHGAIHWLIDKGPHPERSRYHVCSWPINDPPPPRCYPYQSAERALMSRSLGDTDGDANWSREVFTGAFTEYRVTDVDKAFIEWALKATP